MSRRQRTRCWAVIDRHTCMPVAMATSRDGAEMVRRDLQADGFPLYQNRLAVRNVRIPADHGETGSFWKRLFIVRGPN